MHISEPQFQNFLEEAPPPHGFNKTTAHLLSALSAAYSKLFSLYFKCLGEPWWRFDYTCSTCRSRQWSLLSRTPFPSKDWWNCSINARKPPYSKTFLHMFILKTERSDFCGIWNQEMFSRVSSNPMKPLLPQGFNRWEAEKSDFLGIWTNGSSLIAQMNTTKSILHFLIFTHSEKKHG